MWPDRRLLDLVGIELPINQAPMAGAISAFCKAVINFMARCEATSETRR